MRHQGVGHIGRRANMRMIRKARKQLRFKGRVKTDIDNKNRQYVGLARVKATFENGQTLNGLRRNAERLGCQRSERCHGVGHRRAVLVCLAGRIRCAPRVKGQGSEWEFEFGDAQHRGLGVIKQDAMISRGKRPIQSAKQIRVNPRIESTHWA